MVALPQAVAGGGRTKQIAPPAAQSLRRNAAWMAGGQALTWILTALTLALLPRYFGAENLGRIGVAVAFSQLTLTIAGLGMATLITRDIARDRESASRLLATAFWLHIVFGTIGGAVAASLGYALGYETVTWIAIAVMASTVPLDLLTVLGFGTLQGLEVMRYHATWDVAGKLTHLVGLGAVVLFDLGLFPYLGVSFVAALLPCIAATKLMRGFVPFRSRAFSPRLAISIVRSAVPIGAVNMVLIVYLAIDVILLSRLADEAAAGVYAAPMRIFGTLLFAPTIIATVLFPRMSASAVNDRGEFARLCDGAVRVILGITVLAALGASTAGRELIVDLFGPEFAGSGPVLAVMAIALVPTSLNMIAHRILVALDRQAIWTWVMLGALAVKVSLDLALIPAFDLAFDNPALGAATALAVAEAMMMVFAFKLLPGGLLSASLRGHAVGLGAVTVASMGVALLLEPRNVFLAGFATLLAFIALAFATRTYSIGQLTGVVRMARGRSVGAAAMAMADEAPITPLIWEMRRLKENRPAMPVRGVPAAPRANAAIVKGPPPGPWQ